MKCCILAIGGAGEQAARAFAYCTLAGVVEQAQVDILLVDTDTTETSLEAWCADYAKIRSLWPEGRQPRSFRTCLKCQCWPGTLGEEASTLRKLAVEPADQLLLQALFDEDAADADLRHGFHGRSDVGAVLLAGLLNTGDGHASGAMEAMILEAEAALASGEEVRMVLLGSAMGGLGAAGLTVLAAYLQRRLPQAQMAAVALLPYFRGEDEQLAQTRATLRQWAEDGLCDTVYLLGLEQGAYLSAVEGHQQARMPEWLAAACVADFLQTGRRGVYGWRTAFDRFDWDAFGDLRAYFRPGFESLTHAALALRHEMAEVIRRGAAEPRWLRDKMIGWYAQHFMGVRKMDASQREEIVSRLDVLLRLTEGYLAWLKENIASLPPQLRTGSAMDEAIRTSESNYDQLVKLHAQLVMLRQSAERSGLVDTMVHRGGLVDPELEQMSQAIESARAKLKSLEDHQQVCLARTGGQAYLAMLRQTYARCRAEADYFRRQTEEAAALIQQAEENAADKGRIATARTKLLRMEQSLEMLEARCARVKADMVSAKAEDVRKIPPEVGQDTAPACGLFPAEMLEASDRRSLEAAWPGLQQLRERIMASAAENVPMAGFIAALMQDEREGD